MNSREEGWKRERKKEERDGGNEEKNIEKTNIRTTC